MEIKNIFFRVSTPHRIATKATFGLLAVLYGTVAAADCLDQIEDLDRSYSSAGYMLGDSSATTTSGYLTQSRSLRDTALIMLSNDREEQCVELIAEAQRLADKASMPSVFSANELIGREVTDRNGESIGDVEDVMIDLDRGVVAYALVSFGGFLGFGEDLVPVPFAKFSQNPGSEALELASSVEKLENAPRLIKGESDLMSMRSWSTEVYNYYGEDPYWTEQRGKATRIAAQQTASAGQSTQQATELAEQEAEQDASQSGDQAEQDASQTTDQAKQSTGQSGEQAGQDANQTDEQTEQDASQSGDQAEQGTSTASDQTGEDTGTKQESHLADVEKHEPIKSLDDLFAILDTDGSGAVSQDEARREFVVLKRFSEIDGDGNGELASTEFAVLSETNIVSADGQTLIPKPQDAQPEESWTGGKVKKEDTKD